MSNTKGRRYYETIHAQHLPLQTHPLPAFHPSNPFSFLQLAYFLLSERLTTTSTPPSKPSPQQILKSYYSPSTRSVHVTDAETAHRLWRDGFFGKGSLSRSEPEWLERERRRLEEVRRGRRGGTAGEVTERRREERREEKRERARKEREELEGRLRDEGKLVVKEVVSGRAGEGGDKGEEGEVAQVGDESGVGGQKTTQREGKADAQHTNESAARPDNIREDEGGAEVESISNDARENAALHETKQSRTDTDTRPVLKNQEHLQLTPQEAFFLAYGLGILEIHPLDSANVAASKPSKPCLSNHDLLELFRRTSTFPPLPSPTEKPLPPDDAFLLNYLVFHHFRALGWVARPGIKFAVDWLLYAKGPVFAHAEFAVLVLPSYERWPDGKAPSDDASSQHADDARATEGCKEHAAWRERGEWWWLHSANRVQNQVKKTLLLVYVSVPSEGEVALVERDEDGNADIGALLSLYQVREFAIKRWSPNRNRD